MAAARHVATAAAPAEWTETPRRYGFHATLKPPFRLAEGKTLAALHAALTTLAAQLAPAAADRLVPRSLGQFVAFRPEGGSDLPRVAAACVEGLDAFRRPAEQAEIARRRSAGLTARQDAMLARWGYPYVFEEFHFHITLSGRVADTDAVIAAARAHFTPPQPFRLDSLALCEERDGGFALLHRYDLTGESASSASVTA